MRGTERQTPLWQTFDKYSKQIICEKNQQIDWKQTN